MLISLCTGCFLKKLLVSNLRDCICSIERQDSLKIRSITFRSISIWNFSEVSLEFHIITNVTRMNNKRRNIFEEEIFRNIHKFYRKQSCRRQYIKLPSRLKSAIIWHIEGNYLLQTSSRIGGFQSRHPTNVSTSLVPRFIFKFTSLPVWIWPNIIQICREDRTHRAINSLLADRRQRGARRRRRQMAIRCAPARSIKRGISAGIRNGRGRCGFIAIASVNVPVTDALSST